MFDIEKNPDKIHLFTTKTDKLYTDVQYNEGDFLIFGPETRGLPSDILNKYNNSCVTIPMNKDTRSLNLSNSVAIGAYEAIRQFGGIR
jgi:tRNA (cytidine/uridine-2'-O-)-methyltransferase